MKQRRVVLFLVYIFIFIISLKFSLGLGINPGKVTINFEPNFEATITFNVQGGAPDRSLEISSRGDLTEYVTFDKTKLKGSGGTFKATLKLPEKIDKPGANTLAISVREKVDKEIVGMIGVAVEVISVISVYVPYPGKYLEITRFVSNNANKGEPIKFELNLINRGKETIDIQPKIEIFSLEGKKETLIFNQRTLKSQEEIKLQKILDTTKYKPGPYTAKVIADYGDINRVAEQEYKFKIGGLSINITNYTDKIIIGGLKKFEVEIESQWNNKLDNIYANILIIQNSTTLSNFKTSPSSLNPWEKATIEGFFDSSNFTEGLYNTNITLYYSGKTSSKLVKTEFIKEKTNLTTIYIIIATLIIVALIIITYLKIKWKSKKRKK